MYRETQDDEIQTEVGLISNIKNSTLTSMMKIVQFQKQDTCQQVLQDYVGVN